MAKETYLYLFCIVLSSLFFCQFALAQTKPLGFAIPFPELTLDQNLSREEQSYLGIPGKKRFFFREIRGSLILVEFLSTYCVNCQKQAKIFNDLYSSIERNPKLKGTVKMIGIAAGNNLKEVANFKKAHEIPYPIIADQEFNAHTAVGNPRTPFTLWLRRDAQGKSIVVSSHLGFIESLEKVMAETKAVLQYDLALLKPKKGAIYEGDALTPPMPEEELKARAKEGMEASGGKVLEIRKVFFKDGDSIYVGKTDFGTHRRHLFSKLASRRAICDICHDTFFIYTFDTEGKLIDIAPIQLTKNDNINWTEEDLRKLRSRVVGRSILKTFPFDPGVDSVSGATITAVLVFDSLDKAKEIYGKLKEQGYIKR